MQLYLLRHADADTPAEADEDRALSEKGHDQAKKMGAFMARHDMTPEIILSSPVRRAHETAKHVSSALGSKVQTAPWLACGLEPAEGLKEVSALSGRRSVLIVGHEPDFSRLIAHLTGLPTHTAIHVRKASLTLIEIEIFKPGAARIEFFIPCQVL